MHRHLHCRHHQRAGAQVYLPFSNLSSPCSHPNFYKTAANVVNIHVRGVCEPPEGMEIASAIAMSTTSWYFAMCYFFVFQMFDLTLWARKTTTYTTAPRTEDRFRNPTPCPFLLLTWQLSFGHPLIVVESSFTDPVHA